MDEKQKKQINEAIELMKSVCSKHDDEGCCYSGCPLWWICGEYVCDMKKLG